MMGYVNKGNRSTPSVRIAEDDLVDHAEIIPIITIGCIYISVTTHHWEHWPFSMLSDEEWPAIDHMD